MVIHLEQLKVYLLVHDLVQMKDLMLVQLKVQYLEQLKVVDLEY